MLKLEKIVFETKHLFLQSTKGYEELIIIVCK